MFGGLSFPPVVDTDGDSVPDFYDIDCDNDGILNSDENPGLLDGGQYLPGSLVPNYKNPANAGCGTIVNGCCSAYDTDGDGVPNFLDLDSDNDGIPDVIEGMATTFLANGATSTWDNNHYTLATLDVDANAVLDGPFDVLGYDVRVQSPKGSDLTNSAIVGRPDTDSDSRPDFLDLDSDSDGVPDLLENRGMLSTDWQALDSDANSVLGPSMSDADHDGIIDLSDSNPAAFGSPGLTTRPLNAKPSQQPNTSAIDRDGDGVPDFRDLDSDNDGVLDLRESGIVLPLASLDSDSNGVLDDLSTDSDKDGIPASIDSNDSMYGSSIGHGSALGHFIVDTDGDKIPDMYDLDSDNDGVSDLIESGNAAAIAGDTIPVGGDGVIDGPDNELDGIKNAADTQPNVYGSPSQPAPRDSNNDGIPDMLQLYSLVPANGLSDLLRSGRDVSKYDTNNDGIVDGTADNDYDGIIDTTPAPGSYTVDLEPGVFGGLRTPGPKTPTPVISLNIPDFRTTSIDVTSLFVAMYHPLDPASLSSTQPPMVAGSVTVPGYPNVVFNPTPGYGNSSTITISLCDTLGSCSVVIVNLQPYYLRWVSPTLNADWYMYFPSVRSCATWSVRLCDTLSSLMAFVSSCSKS